MTIYIDPPLWPAHGTMFSHLISDTSVTELHDFADRAGIPERAFDRDHYDVPQHRRDELLAAGALPVSAGMLTRILAASGLRIPASARPEKLRPRLRTMWDKLLPGTESIAAELLDRWSEPHRHYHGLVHLAAVLREIGTLERAGELRLRAEPDRGATARVRLAAWFHDSVYRGAAGADEQDSAELASALLGPHLPAREVADVVRLVLLTTDHVVRADDAAGAVLSDADLAVLGSEPHAYERYAATVRQDFSHVPETDFRLGRARVLDGLLERSPLYATETARQRWEAAARLNMRRELSALRRV